MSASRRAQLLLAAALASLPSLAGAHGDLDGLNAFVAGALHPFLVPAHAVALLALAVLIGQRSLAASHHGLTVLLGALLVGLLGTAWTNAVSLEHVVLVAGGLCALAVVLAFGPPTWVLCLLAATIGVGVGLGSAPETRIAADRWTALAGTGIGAFLSVTVLSSLIDSWRRPWTAIGLRVVGSWLAASALLVLALAAWGPAAVSDKSAPVVAAPAR